MNVSCNKNVKERMMKLISSFDAAPVITGHVGEFKINSTNSINITDKYGNIWCISIDNKDSMITNNVSGRTNLLFQSSNREDVDFVSVYGTALISADIPMNDFEDATFFSWLNKVGPTKSVVGLKLTPDELNYWDTSNYKYATLFKSESGSKVRPIHPALLDGDAVAMSA